MKWLVLWGREEDNESCISYCLDSKRTSENPVPLKASSVRLDDDTLSRVGQMAEAMDSPRAWLMEKAIQDVTREEWFIHEVEKGVKDADEGNLINHADLKARWEAKRAAQVD